MPLAALKIMEERGTVFEFLIQKLKFKYSFELHSHWPHSKITPEGVVENRARFCAGCNPTGGHREAAGFCGNNASR